MDMDMNIIKNGGVSTPLGFRTSAVAADIKGNKKGRLDLGILLSDMPCKVAGVFTKNMVKAAPVISSQNLINNSEILGIIANSGNANACTGKIGLEDVANITRHFEKIFKLPGNSLFMSSTGVIGVRLPVKNIIDSAEELFLKLDDSDEDFTKAIMTTDTFSKSLAVLVETGNGAFVIGGCAKGAGMIAPSMATMLSFITTDAMISKELLQRALEAAVKESFNRITVDGDMSTNDSVYIFANGFSGIAIQNEELYNKFYEGLKFVCLELAKMIVKDGEGATKLVKIQVKNAKSEEDAKVCAFKVGNSPLVKTMFFGNDPNWGRLLASAGASLIEMDPENIDIYFDDLHYVSCSTIIDLSLESKVHDIMKKDSYTITIDLNYGNFEYSVYTSDLTYDYVKINADYRT